MNEAARARCLDKNWQYTRSEATDITKLFARVRREQKAAAAPKPANVQPIKRAKP